MVRTDLCSPTIHEGETNLPRNYEAHHRIDMIKCMNRSDYLRNRRALLAVHWSNLLDSDHPEWL
jgi:hypothetical protein